MNLYFLSVIIASVLLISVSFASAEEDTRTIKFINSGEKDGSSPIYAFVQVTHRNSNGDLLALIQSEKMTDLNANAVNLYIDRGTKMENRQPQIVTVGGHTMELFSEIFTNTIDRTDMTASTLLMISMPAEDNQNELIPHVAVRFAHDGLLLNPGDIITTSWYFIRIL